MLLQSVTRVQQSGSFQRSPLKEEGPRGGWRWPLQPVDQTHKDDCGSLMLPWCSMNAVSAQTDRPSRMLLYRRERWTCRNTLPPSPASSPNADDITTTRMATIFTNLKPWVNAEARPGLNADTPYGTCSLPEPLPFSCCGPLEDLCQLKKIRSVGVSIRVNVALQAFSFSLIVQDSTMQRQWSPLQLICSHV